MRFREIQVDLDFVFERLDSKFVKWVCVEDQSDYPEDYSGEWSDDIGCFETESWPLPGDHTTIEPGDRLHVKGPATISFTESFTCNGHDYSSDIDWDDSQMRVGIVKNAEP